MKKILIVLTILSNIVLGQTANTYTVTTGTAGTVRNPAWTQIIGGCIDDGVSTVQNIGFNFIYEGTTYTQFSVNSNGLIKLGGVVITDEWSNNATSTTNRPKLMPCWEDMETGVDGFVRFGVAGTSPNRILTIEMSQLSHVEGSAPCDEPRYMRVQTNLYEGTNVIEFVYVSLISTSFFSQWIYCWGNADIGIGGANASNYLTRNNSINHTFNSTSEGSGILIERWPGEGINGSDTRRWYRFTPPATAPVTLSLFDYDCKKGELIWTTLSEKNSDRFVIEYSYNTEIWYYLKSVQSSGNSNTVINYNTSADPNIYYRLKQLDFDGKYEYFGPIYSTCIHSVPNKRIIGVYNILGENIDVEEKIFKIIIYSDGSYEKRIE